MTIFAIIPTRDEHQIEAALSKQSSDVLQWMKLPRGEYLASYKGTTIELCNILGITEGVSGLAVVFATSSYYGRASNDTWEWIKTHWEA